MGIFGFFNKDKKDTLDKGLEKTKTSVFDKLTRAIAGKSKVDDDVLDNLEEVLITSDVGVDTTLKIIERIEERVARDKYVNTSELNAILRDEIADLLAENNSEDNDNWDLPSDHKPYVILVVGVNGVGKTTTIGKLAWQFKQAGKKVYLGAADTFRAAAVEQLCIWGERVGVPVVKQQMGSDPASVAFDTLSSAKANGADVVLIDTAGRLHNKVGLMNELKKIKDVMKKVLPEAPDEVMLVLDGSTFMVLDIQRVVVGEMGHAIVSKTIATKLLRIGIQHHFVRACRYKEAIIGIAARRREIEHKDKVATHIAQHLIAVVVPYLSHRRCLEILLRLDDLKHLAVEIAQPMITQVLIVDEVPLSAGILV